MTSFYEHLLLLSQTDPGKPALLSCNASGTIVETVSRAQLLNKVQAAATYLIHKGLVVGDRVALQFGNSADLLALSWAAWSMGIVTVPLDSKRDTDELLAYKLKVSGAKLMIQQEDYLPEVPIKSNIPWVPDMSHDALILFTSGTTAYPKGARLTLQNLMTNAEGIVDWLGLTADDRFLVVLPLHHINSTVFCVTALLAHASIAIPPAYSNSRFFMQAALSGSTVTSVVPSIVFDQLSRKEEFETTRKETKLNRIQLGSAPVLVSDAVQFVSLYGIPLYQGYGQTETALRVTGVPMGLTEDTYNRLLMENSIGTPMGWADVEIADDTGTILGEKEEGEIIVKGSAVMKGYVGGEPAFRNGYFLTGDMGYWKEIGGRRFFYLIGRSKEILIKGGVNISPVAVENALKRMSDDVEQVYVIGATDPRYGEEVAAVVVWKPDIDQSAALRKLKWVLLLGHELLSPYESPKFITSVAADELPMTSTGKVQRTILKKRHAEHLTPVSELFKSSEFSFIPITTQSTLFTESHALYNHCWQPLTKNVDAYRRFLNEYITIGALDASSTLVGQISFSYKNNTLTCVSICSSAFRFTPAPIVETVPEISVIENYIQVGHDPVMNFHKKLGAEFVELIPDGRPEDTSSLGYTMLLRYPSLKSGLPTGPGSHQLIYLVRLMARDMGAEVIALSRPGGLAAYIHRQS